MAGTAAYVALTVRRNEVARFTIAVTGLDLTGVDMKMQVRLSRGNPQLLFALATVGTAAAEGLKLDSVTAANGVSTSIITGRINASTMTDPVKVPYAGATGSDQTLAFAMTWTISGDTQVRIEGPFVVVDSAYNSDGAPANRQPGYGSASSSSAAPSGSLQFGDQVVQVTITDAAIVGLLADRATDAAVRAEAARDQALGTTPAKVLAQAQQAFGLPQRNLFVRARATLDYRVDEGSGAIVQQAGQFVSDFIAVFAFDCVTISRWGPGVTVAAYDANRTLVGVVGGSAGGTVTSRNMNGDGANALVVLPAGVAYIRFSQARFVPTDGDRDSPNAFHTQPLNRYPELQLALPGDVAIPPYYDSGAMLAASRPVMASDLSPWAGKTIAVQGDSKSTFEYGDQRWLEQCAAVLGVGRVKNWAMAGRTMEGALTKAYTGTALTQADLADVDALFLDLGINDYLNDVPVGTLADATTAATYCGRARKAIEQFINWKPAIRLFLNTPTRISFNGKADPAAYRAALFTLADYYAIAVNDLYRTSGDNALTIASRTIGDSLHHTPAGLIAAKVNPSLAFLRSVASPTT